jgi:membrane-bound lytic murein transglycosylase A
LVYVSDPVDAFFLDIQGSGRVTLDDGKVIRVSYDAQNGRALTMIGRVLADRGAIERKKVSMQTIRAWLAANPGSATEVMNTNASYVFFREVEVSDPNIGPPGAQGVPLTPGHSLAVDRKFHALGVPVWLETTTPELGPDKPSKPLHRLFVAQDTGGAIRGPVRGDTFWGFGKEAADIAGEMKQMGSMTLLLPNPVAARLAEAK